MAHGNRVLETTHTAGTGSVTLAGATPGHATFASTFAPGTAVQYGIYAVGRDWEVGRGTLVDGATLSRDTVEASSTGGAKIDFGSGAKLVWTAQLASEVVDRTGVQTLTNKTISGASNTFSNIPANAVVGVLMADGDLRAYGAPSGNSAADTALVTTALTAIGSKGILVIPEGTNYNVEQVTVPSGVLVVDHENARIIASKVAAGSSVTYGDHWLFRDTRSNHPTRVHLEPRGHVASGTATKFDLLITPYEDDGVNYCLGNFYTIVDDASQMSGQSAIVVVGAKGVGDWFAIQPTINFGFGDNQSSGVPLKLVKYDTSDTAWRTPMRGAWRAGRAITTGDYVSAGATLYVAASSGTTGATEPVHAAGTVSDGGVSWTFVRDYTGPAGSGQYASQVIIGDRDDMPKFGLLAYRLQLAKGTAVWSGIPISFLGLDNLVAWKISSPAATTEFKIESADGTRFLRFGSTFVQNIGQSWLESTKSIADNSATPTVTACEKVTFANGSTTSVTSMTGTANQRLRIQSGNNNTTLVHGASIKLVGHANRLLVSGETIINGTFSAGGTVFTEDGYRPAVTLTSGTTPSVAGYAQATFNYPSPATVTAITGTPGQAVRLRATNGNVTLQQGATLLLNTGANKVLTANSNLTGIISADGTGFIEDGTL